MPLIGLDLEALTTTMDEEELQKTINAQRAIHACHLGHWFAYRESVADPGVQGVIGHSMGILAALVVADVLSVEDSSSLIVERARIFSRVCADLGEDWGLLAVQTDDLQDLIDELPRVRGLELALRNTRGKGVVGGRLEDLRRLMQIAETEEWPVHARLLKVEGPYHTTAFETCREEWERALQSVRFDEPSCAVFMGTSGRQETDPARMRELLMQQPMRTELHYQAVRSALEAGFQNFLEVSHAPQPIQWIPEILTGAEEASCEKVLTADLEIAPAQRKTA